jgi:small-conductance mechanosensitive channel
MHTRGVISLVLTVLLCLPSLTGAMAVLANVLLQRDVGEWGVGSSALVATAVFIGRPLVVIAVVVSGLVGLSRSISQEVKYAHYLIVTLATIATFSLILRFGL